MVIDGCDVKEHLIYVTVEVLVRDRALFGECSFGPGGGLGDRWLEGVSGCWNI